MNRSCVQVNRAAALKILELGECYTKYPHVERQKSVFETLSGSPTALGYKLFLNKIYGGLETDACALLCCLVGKLSDH